MKGVCYLSNIPKKMKVMDMRSIFDPYNIEKIYLKPKSLFTYYYKNNLKL